MRKPYPHKRRELIQLSFPNNKLSTRPRKKRVVKHEIIEDDFQVYSRLPSSAISTPYALPNPTDSAPSFFNTQTINYSEIGGYAPPGFSDEFSPVQMGMVPGMIPGLENSNFDPSPVALMLDVGHGFSWVAVPDQGYTETGGVQEFFLVSGLDNPSMYTGGYNVNVTIYDMAGNAAYMEREMDGLFSGVMDFLTMIWDGLCGVMEAAADAVGAAMSWLVEMIMDIVQGLLDTVLAPIVAAFNSLVNGYLNCYHSPLDIGQFLDLMFNSAFTILALALIATVLIVQYMFAPFTFSIGMLIPIIIGIIISALFVFSPVGDIVFGEAESTAVAIITSFHNAAFTIQYLELIALGSLSVIKALLVASQLGPLKLIGWDLYLAVLGILCGIASVVLMMYHISTWEEKDNDERLWVAGTGIAMNVFFLIWYSTRSNWKILSTWVTGMLYAFTFAGLIASITLFGAVVLDPAP